MHHVLSDGFQAEGLQMETARQERGENKTAAKLNIMGLERAQAMAKIALKGADMKYGDILEILGDSPWFEQDVRTWCDRIRKAILRVRDDTGSKKMIWIQF